MRRPPRQMFSNQLGGWSANKRTTNKPFFLEVTTPMRTYACPIASGQTLGSVAVTINGAVDLTNTNFTAFQRFRIKKAEIFLQERESGGSGISPIVQIGIAKLRADRDDRNAFSIAGCQSKMMTTSGSGGSISGPEIDVLRAACMYPTLDIEAEAGGTTVSTVRQQAYMDSSKTGQATWNAFILSCKSTSPATSATSINFVIYYKLTIELIDPAFSTN